MSNIGTKFNLANKFTFDPNTNSLIEKDNDVDIIRLGSNESRILLLLVEKPNLVVTRNELHDFVWREQGFEVDDSSLTQAISTLRKFLKDSTKSPEYVKTVPKRGYQLICSVERMTPLISGDTPIAMPQENSVMDSIEEHEPEINLTEDVEREVELPEAPLAQAPQPTHPKTASSWLTKVLIALALILPLLALSIDKPTDSQFRQINSFDGVVVKTPINHPDLSHWYSAIEQCVVRYKKSHLNEAAPVEVIATGGQNNQLVLNYIHRLDHSGENITLRIFSDQNDLDHICQ
ncbi:hypothetical protein VII00023_18994 [Vibrio ichthyoenteri ATCC 700023]|uniref:OmpR/PhoB-type domain-containing protein n=1 Tax=Vibrio ichthyoenteri ATCC 700023 TaxID=870968 RepID=F9S5B9_9VIBR|nr:transcriptional regulator [Vibrio ichthyoenteri]EGU35930.1 hypothetical protein VII00023_18994 [Vibrio ichthyoenteri ATCC 700023]